MEAGPRRLVAKASRLKTPSERRVNYRVNSIPGRHSQIAVKRLTFPKNVEFDQFTAREVAAVDDE